MSIFRVTGAHPGEALVFDSLAASLAEPGYGIFPDLIAADLVTQAQAFLQAKIDEGELVRSGVGKGAALSVRPEIRSDLIYWLDEATDDPFSQSWLAAMDALREFVRASLFLPLESYEGHLARYPKEGFYKPHLDQHKLSPTRQMTLILYLNDDWSEEDGGQLRLYTDKELGIRGPFLDVQPRAGTLVVFRSADFWHEVLPAKRPRNSLTGWFRGRETNPLFV